MRAIIIWTFVLCSGFAHAQYRSEIDDLLTVRTISILPVFDNLQGIYARPVETDLIDTFQKNHRFEYAQSTFAGPILTPDELEENPQLVQQIARGLNADAFVATRIVKGPGGISIRMSMFLTKDSKLLLHEEIAGLKSQDLETVKKQTRELFAKLLADLPYDGVILSRQGTRVTLNLGSLDGMQKDAIVSVVQIIKAIRHPKFDFLVSTEKEILGKVKLLKVEDTLSFGRIVTEKEAGAITVLSKIAGSEGVTYANTDSLSDTLSEDSITQKPGAEATFGKNPVAWLPTRAPTFGMIGARLGFGTYSEKMKTSSDSLAAKSSIYPFMGVEGELWLTPVWSLHAGLRQGIISTDNPVAGGDPGDLSHQLSAYEFLVGYNLRMGATATSPKVEVMGGYSTYRMYVDDSTPAGLTTKTYSGMKFGVSGFYPLSDTSPFSMGANLFLFFDAHMNEKPGTSGRSTNDITQFGAFVDQALKINLKVRYSLDFELYDSTYTGGAASSSSQRHTSASAGLYYMF